MVPIADPIGESPVADAQVSGNALHGRAAEPAQADFVSL
jgi:hypothetical protein